MNVKRNDDGPAVIVTNVVAERSKRSISLSKECGRCRMGTQLGLIQLCPGDNHHVGLARTGTEHLGAKTSEIIRRCGGGCDHFDCTAAQTLAKGPDRAGTGPVLCPLHHVYQARQPHRQLLLPGGVLGRSRSHSNGHCLAACPRNLAIPAARLFVAHCITLPLLKLPPLTVPA